MKPLRVAAAAMIAALLGACATTGGAPGAPGAPSKPAPPSTGTSRPAPSTSGSGESGRPDAGKAGTAGTSDSAGTIARNDSGNADGPAKTPSERRADIDGKLDASLGKFDEQLRREQQRNAEERDARTASRAAGAAVDEVASGREAAGENNRDRAGDLRSDTTTARNGNDPAAGGNTVAGSQGGIGGGGAAVKPIPSGEDDDIIARRLRKAAESETDPELKEKLWKEYRDYKENTGGRR